MSKHSLDLEQYMNNFRNKLDGVTTEDTTCQQCRETHQKLAILLSSDAPLTELIEIIGKQLAKLTPLATEL